MCRCVAGSAAVIQALQPRYVFSASNSAFYERAPYSNTEPGKPPVTVTRFYAVAKVGNPEKEKWLYAFNVVPATKIDPGKLVEQPPGTTPTPFVGGGSRRQSNQQNHESFFFGAQRSKGPQHERKRKRHDELPAYNHTQAPRADGQHFPAGPRGKATTEQECWFCLGGSKVATHLVASVGQKMYLALPKGWLTPDHVLIIPIHHVRNSVELEDQAHLELRNYKAALRKYYKEKNMACVMWERNWKSQHMQLQACGIPLDKAGAVRDAYFGHGLKMRPDFAWEEIDADTKLDATISRKRPYFYVTLPDGSQLLHFISGKGFPIQFGREVLCSILGTPERIEWKACAVDDAAEKAATKAFRAAFKPYDFNLMKKCPKVPAPETAKVAEGGSADATE